jgi:hypothetical protein
VASPEIAFALTPPDAVLSVDGQELAPGLRALPRPAIGKTATVVARARGHEDATLRIDYFTAAPLEITLRPLPFADPPTPGGGPDKDASRKDPPKKDPSKPPGGAEGARPKPPPRGVDPSLPPNPF